VCHFDYPPLDFLPPFLRGRRILSLRFAYPGTPEEGAKLAAPLRAAAPVYMDLLGELPVTEIGKIHSDPENPAPIWFGAQYLTHIDQVHFLILSDSLYPPLSFPRAASTIPLVPPTTVFLVSLPPLSFYVK
jgi:hypothetical protein